MKKRKHRPAAKARPKRSANPRPVSAPPLEIEKELRRLRSARNSLERRLTAAVQEIGLLRQYELRAQMLEGELGELRVRSEERIRDLESRLHGASIVATPE
jgi:hypothetical protein